MNLTNDLIISQLRGGLGNQLFQISAAMVASEISGFPAVFDVSRIQGGRIIRENSLDTLQITSGPASLPIKTVELQYSKYFDALIEKSSLIRTISTRFGNTYIEKNPIDDLISFKFTRAARLRGYFQSWLFQDFLKSRGLQPSLVLRKQSGWFTELSEEIARIKSLSIHVRRGDYYQLRESVGILDLNYYESAARDILSRMDVNQIFIFSDDALVGNALSKRLGSLARYVNEPRNSNPAEVMLLMAKSRALITSNSSLSWWSANLSEPDSFIVVPSSWYLNLPETLHLRNPDWHTHSSEWERW